MSEETKPATFSEITQDMIEAWKLEGKKPSQVTIPIDEDDLDEDAAAKFIICPPSRPVLNAVTKYSSEKDYDRANRVLIKNCVLGGDMDAMKNHLKVELTLLEKIGELLNVKGATVKKL